MLAGCGATAHVAKGTGPPSDAPNCPAGVVKRAGSADVAVAAVVVRSSAKAYRRPGTKPFARFGRKNVNGFPTFFRVLGTVRGPDCAPRWFRVQLPIKPNGATGYIRARAVATGRVHSRVVVDLSARRLTLFRRGRRVFSTPVAVGSSATPTPTGRYYVNQRLIPRAQVVPTARRRSASPPTRRCSPAGRRAGRSRFTGRTSRGRSACGLDGCIRVRNPVLGACSR